MAANPQQQAQALWKATAAALLSSDEVDALYVRLEGLAVALDSDPLAFGPKRLQEKTALCRTHLTTVERIFLDVSRRLHGLKRICRAKKAALDLATKLLYVEDPEVRAGRNIADRDAFAAIKLKAEWMSVHEAEQSVGDHEAVMYVIKAKRSDLRDTQGRLRDQVRLCGQELELGGRWGTKRLHAPDLEPGQGVATGSDAQDVLDLIDEMDVNVGEVNLPALSDDDDDDETLVPAEAAPPEEVWVDPTAIDMDELDAQPETVVEAPAADPFPDLKSNGKTAVDVLPSNGSTGEDIDRLLSQVQIPEAAAAKGPGITDQNLDSLLEMFE